jgi:hypothetical protein
MPHFPMDSGFKSSPESSRDNNNNTKLSIQTKNRRKRYLDLHPEYFSAELELAGPRALPHCIQTQYTTQQLNIINTFSKY